MNTEASLFSTPALATGFAWIAVVLFAIGLLTLLARRRYGGGKPTLLDHLPGGVGLLALFAHVIMSGKALGRFPVGNLSESVIFLALLLAIACVYPAVRFRHMAVSVVLNGLILIFLLLGLLGPVNPDGATEYLGSRWFVFHTMAAFLGVTALVAAGVVSSLYLLTEIQLKQKRPGRLLRSLPSLVACDGTALRLLVFGFPLLSIGVVTGAFWMREVGVHSWGPKELSAMIAWIIYAALLGARIVGGWSGRRAAVLSIAGAAAVIIAVLGIRL